MIGIKYKYIIGHDEVKYGFMNHEEGQVHKNISDTTPLHSQRNLQFYKVITSGCQEHPLCCFRL